MKKRTLALLCAVTMIVGIAVGGTLAWLVSNGGSVTNTFTIGDVTATLAETGAEDGQKAYEMVPGQNEAKDPNVTISTDSVDCYLFVKVTDTNVSTYINYQVDGSMWTALDASAYPGVYYYKNAGTDNKITDAEKDAPIYILDCIATHDPSDPECHGCVTMKETVKKRDRDQMIVDAPELEFVAYAIQADGMDGKSMSEIYNIASDPDQW